MTSLHELRSALLAAEPDELRGIGESQVARAVRTDPRIRMEADAVLLAMTGLNTALDQVAARQSAFAATDSVAPIAAYRIRRPRHRVWIGAGSLAAAVLAAVLLVHSRSAGSAELPVLPDSPLSATLQAEADQPFGVFATDNPDIAVVWLFPKEGE